MTQGNLFTVAGLLVEYPHGPDTTPAMMSTRRCSAAAALVDMEMNWDQGEDAVPDVPIPGVAFHALEQWKYGMVKYP